MGIEFTPAPTSAFTTPAPTFAFTTPAPTFAFTTPAPTFALTTAPPVAAPTPPAPAPAGQSLAGLLSIQTCISGSNVTVTLENFVSMVVPWSGTSFGPVAFAAFNTVNNIYPAYTVSGQLNGSMLDVTVTGNGQTEIIPIANIGDGACPA